MKLRPYQARTLDELWAHMAGHRKANPIVEACVGAGKSLMIAAVAQRAEAEAPGVRVLVIVHQKELLQQNLQKLLAVWPGADVGVISSAMGRRQLGHQITYATIGSVYKLGLKLGRIDIVMADECFVDGTPILMADGSHRPIELVRPGDVVKTAAGLGTVTATRSKDSDDLYVVRFSDGGAVVCTGNHPFLTRNGFVQARSLERGARLVGEQELPALWRGVQAVPDDGRDPLEEAEVLFDLVRQEVGEPDALRECARGNGAPPSGDPSSSAAARWEWVPAHIDGAWSLVPSRGGVGVGATDSDPQAEGVWVARSLQAGHQQPETDALHRGGRQLSCIESRSGFTQGHVPEGIWVDGVARLEGGRRASVHNLQVSGHPSYVAGGVVVHNCHLINPKDTGMWRSFLGDLQRVCPHARVIGWTGTPFRGNGVWLTAGEQALFGTIATRVKMAELLEAGFLAPLVPAVTQTLLSADGVRTSGDDYVVSELAKLADQDHLVQATCDEIVQLGQARRRWLVFAVTVEHAEHVRDALVARDVAAGMVTGDTPKAERDATIERFRRGELRCLVNVAVLTTGFDVPAVDAIFLLRATKSPVLYVQIAGRGMRCLGADMDESRANGKHDCLWADFTTTTVDLGPVDQIKGRMPAPRGSSEAPFRLCPECGSRNQASALECTTCGHQFPEPERIKHTAEANGAQVLSTGAPTSKMARVTDVVYSEHMGSERKTMRVEYMDGIKVVAREWICFDHDGFARRKAELWWNARSKFPPPPSVEMAVQYLQSATDALRKPTELELTVGKKYPEIIRYVWEE